MGDEGKGRVVHEILEQTQKTTGNAPFGVIKVNGGANAGHTAAGLKLNLLPSGVGNPDVEIVLKAFQDGIIKGEVILGMDVRP